MSRLEACQGGDGDRRGDVRKSAAVFTLYVCFVCTNSPEQLSEGQNHKTVNVDGAPGGGLVAMGFLLEGADLMRVDLKAFGNSEV